MLFNSKSLTRVFVVLCFVIAQSSHSVADELKFVHVITRHGDRTPTSFYPTDPYKNETEFWPEGLGQLTNVGKYRMFRLGQALRERYNDFLSDSPREVSVRSSASERCLESAEALAAGLYPPEGDWIWSNLSARDIGKHWLPIAVQTVPKSEDLMLVTSSKCPAADRAWEEFMAGEPVSGFVRKNQDWFDRIGNHTGEVVTTLRQMDFLSGTLRAEAERGLRLPDWLTDDNNALYDKVMELGRAAFYYDWMDSKVQRLRTSTLLQEITHHWNEAASGGESRKIALYNTHDTFLVLLMQSLQVFRKDWLFLPYAVSVIFEFHQTDPGDQENPEKNSFYVKVFYYNETANFSAPSALSLPLCQNKTSCDVEMFKQRIQHLIVENVTVECNVSDRDWSGWVYSALGAGVGAVVMAILMLFCFSVIRKATGRRSSYIGF